MAYFEFTWVFFQNFFAQFAVQIFHVIVILISLTIVKKIGVGILNKIFQIKIGKLTRTTPESLKQKETIKQLSINIFKYAFNLLKVILVVSVFVPIGTLMASVGALAVVVTFTFQNMLSNMVRGFFIIFEEQIMVGDWVQISGFRGESLVIGEVLECGLQTTKLRTYDTEEVVFIPNMHVIIVKQIDYEKLKLANSHEDE